ncbi:diguanylate cyclase with GAF sensor [Solidesulfovibrio carbinoliphilus subsp. oakridgensis]|uniref:diguanylate cyclase n=1 Tax=Solidesulfovibrio carbinoliphilus subsp. oakridgensis TaxID=694327 RepID=G7Q476_9BACT|nr:sensor domain-containing diguanylate cyclase [Solidesulfovibrio carbinoliphilus]EHJ46944.1 diguanylate cyclase with GAF sensor [Solidesulfovibrio carbinoliphilus subsp. oakridgensis]
MTRGMRPEQVWGIGLREETAAEISAALGNGYVLRNWPHGKHPGERDLGRATPLVIFVVKEAWEALPSSSRKRLEQWEVPQRVLVLSAAQPMADFDELLEQGFLSAVSEPLSDKKIRDVIFRAKEVKSLYDDIFRMTREIMLERELLARKTDLVLFLNRILTRATESLDPTVILDNAREDLELLLPMRGLLGILWQPGDSGALEAELFLEPEMDHDTERHWTEQLLRQAAKLAGKPMQSYRTTFLDGCPGREPVDVPRTVEEVISLPLRAGGQTFGLLSLYRAKGPALGKDQVQALYASINHLALALKNAALFSQVKVRADHDGLTRIHNRRAFDERLVEELRRHQRYHHPMSLLMLDIDHFKGINDTYGHLVGDHVLREVGRLMTETLRSTDFTARYGGEEFVIILPQTAEEQSRVLAERLRGLIADARFVHDGHPFSITVSIGAATLLPGALSKRKDLLDKADKALYQAKTLGRNQVCTALGPVSRTGEEAVGTAQAG